MPLESNLEYDIQMKKHEERRGERGEAQRELDKLSLTDFTYPFVLLQLALYR